MKQRLQQWTLQGLYVLSWSYYLGVCVWALLFWLFRDRWWWLFLVNSFAFYLFVPLPFFAMLAIILRRWKLWGGFLFALLPGIILYAGNFAPKGGEFPESGAILRVMTYNTLAYNSPGRPKRPERIVHEILASNADVVALQELNPEIVRAIRRNLSQEYPYLELKSSSDNLGLGILSRYQLRELDVTVAEQPEAAPQVFQFSFAGTAVTLINFHGLSSNFEGGIGKTGILGFWEKLSRLPIREREQQVQALASLARQLPGPVLLAGDLNATERSTAYTLLAEDFHDAWAEAGTGLGHTFPGAHWMKSPWEWGRIAGFPVPLWAVSWALRLDFIFFSDHWQVLNAEIGPWMRGSDHRPVIATFTFK